MSFLERGAVPSGRNAAKPTGSPLEKTPKPTLSCWQLLFNFFPQLMFDIIKVLEQNLGCGWENFIKYYRVCTPLHASHVICSELPGFYRFLTKIFFNITSQPYYTIWKFVFQGNHYFYIYFPILTHRKVALQNSGNDDFSHF